MADTAAEKVQNMNIQEYGGSEFDPFSQQNNGQNGDHSDQPVDLLGDLGTGEFSNGIDKHVSYDQDAGIGLPNPLFFNQAEGQGHFEGQGSDFVQRNMSEGELLGYQNEYGESRNTGQSEYLVDEQEGNNLMDYDGTDIDQIAQGQGQYGQPYTEGDAQIVPQDELVDNYGNDCPNAGPSQNFYEETENVENDYVDTEGAQGQGEGHLVEYDDDEIDPNSWHPEMDSERQRRSMTPDRSVSPNAGYNPHYLMDPERARRSRTPERSMSPGGRDDVESDLISTPSEMDNPQAIGGASAPISGIPVADTYHHSDPRSQSSYPLSSETESIDSRSETEGTPKKSRMRIPKPSVKKPLDLPPWNDNVVIPPPPRMKPTLIGKQADVPPPVSPLQSPRRSKTAPARHTGKDASSDSGVEDDKMAKSPRKDSADGKMRYGVDSKNESYKPGGGNIQVFSQKMDTRSVKGRTDTSKPKSVLSPRASPAKERSPMTPKPPTPNTKQVQSKIGSLNNVKHSPGGGNVKVLNAKVDFSNVGSKVGSKDKIDHKPMGGDKKIESQKLSWQTESKVGSLKNAKHSPGGGNLKIGELFGDDTEADDAADSLDNSMNTDEDIDWQASPLAGLNLPESAPDKPCTIESLDLSKQLITVTIEPTPTKPDTLVSEPCREAEHSPVSNQQSSSPESNQQSSSQFVNGDAVRFTSYSKFLRNPFSEVENQSSKEQPSSSVEFADIIQAEEQSNLFTAIEEEYDNLFNSTQVYENTIHEKPSGVPEHNVEPFVNRDQNDILTTPLDNSGMLTTPLNNSDTLTTPIDYSDMLNTPLDNGAVLTTPLDYNVMLATSPTKPSRSNHVHWNTDLLDPFEHIDQPEPSGSVMNETEQLELDNLMKDIIEFDVDNKLPFSDPEKKPGFHNIKEVNELENGRDTGKFAFVNSNSQVTSSVSAAVGRDASRKKTDKENMDFGEMDSHSDTLKKRLVEKVKKVFGTSEMGTGRKKVKKVSRFSSSASYDFNRTLPFTRKRRREKKKGFVGEEEREIDVMVKYLGRYGSPMLSRKRRNTTGDLRGTNHERQTKRNKKDKMRYKHVGGDGLAGGNVTENDGTVLFTGSKQISDSPEMKRKVGKPMLVTRTSLISQQYRNTPGEHFGADTGSARDFVNSVKGDSFNQPVSSYRCNERHEPGTVTGRLDGGGSDKENRGFVNIGYVDDEIASDTDSSSISSVEFLSEGIYRNIGGTGMDRFTCAETEIGPEESEHPLDEIQRELFGGSEGRLNLYRSGSSADRLAGNTEFPYNTELQRDKFGYALLNKKTTQVPEMKDDFKQVLNKSKKSSVKRCSSCSMEISDSSYFPIVGGQVPKQKLFGSHQKLPVDQGRKYSSVVEELKSVLIGLQGNENGFLSSHERLDGTTDSDSRSGSLRVSVKPFRMKSVEDVKRLGHSSSFSVKGCYSDENLASFGRPRKSQSLLVKRKNGRGSIFGRFGDRTLSSSTQSLMRSRDFTELSELQASDVDENELLENENDFASAARAKCVRSRRQSEEVFDWFQQKENEYCNGGFEDEDEFESNEKDRVCMKNGRVSPCLDTFEEGNEKFPDSGTITIGKVNGCLDTCEEAHGQRSPASSCMPESDAEMTLDWNSNHRAVDQVDFTDYDQIVDFLFSDVVIHEHQLLYNIE